MDVWLAVVAVCRMHRKIDGVRINMTLILLQSANRAQNKHVFNITKLGYMLIEKEPQRAKTCIRQYHQYQKLGHSLDNCLRSRRCVKCGQQHITILCKKPRDTAVIPANCRGPHPVNFRSCMLIAQTRLSQQVRPVHQPRDTAGKSTPTQEVVSSSSGQVYQINFDQ